MMFILLFSSLKVLFRAVDCHCEGGDVGTAPTQQVDQVDYAEFEAFLCGSGRFGEAGRFRARLFGSV